MAVLGTDEDDPNNPNNGSLPSPSGNVIGGGAGGFVGGTGVGQGGGATTSVAPVSAGNTAAPAAKGSGSFTNLSQYLSANRGGSAGSTGQGVENVLNQAANNAADFGGKYQTDAQSAIAAGGQNLGVNQNVMNSIQGGVAKVDPATLSQIKAGIVNVDPTTLAKIQAQGNNVDGTYKGPEASSFQYGGPQSVDTTYKAPTINTSDYASYIGPNDTASFGGPAATSQASALGAVSNAAQQAKNSTNFSGLSSLLKSAYQQPNYTAGENSLDAFLIGGDQGAKQAVANGAANANAAQGRYDAINNALSGQIQNTKNQAQTTNQAYTDAIGRAAKDTTAADKYGADIGAAKAASQKSIDTYLGAEDKAKSHALDLKSATAKAQAELDTKAAAAKAQAQANDQAVQKALSNPAAVQAAISANAPARVVSPPQPSVGQVIGQSIGGTIAGSQGSKIGQAAGQKVSNAVSGLVPNAVKSIKSTPQVTAPIPTQAELGQAALASLQAGLGRPGAFQSALQNTPFSPMGRMLPTTVQPSIGMQQILNKITPKNPFH